LTSCSFDYDLPPADAGDIPDVAMENVEYVRMENGKPLVRLEAGEGRRYEKKHLMELADFSFEQYNSSDGSAAEPEVNVKGSGGLAKVETDTGNFSIEGGVSIEVASEDIALTAESISWKNEERHLTAPDSVDVTRSDGTTFRGAGLSADIRARSWEFSGSVAGKMVDEEKKDEKTEEISHEQNEPRE
jgi:LPS export ABC transporter protein LptC